MKFIKGAMQGPLGDIGRYIDAILKLQEAVNVENVTNRF